MIGEFLLSLKLASLSTAWLLVTGLPFTYWLSRQRGTAAQAIEALLFLPLVLPPTVLGFYLLLALSRAHLAFTFPGLLLAITLVNVPFAWQPFLAAFRGVEPRYLDAGRILGEGGGQVFLRVAVPLARNGILTGVILAFAHALGEFGVVLMIGGNIAGVSRTLSLALYDSVESFQYAEANRAAALLTLFSAGALFLVARLRARGPFP